MYRSLHVQIHAEHGRKQELRLSRVIITCILNKHRGQYRPVYKNQHIFEFAYLVTRIRVEGTLSPLGDPFKKDTLSVSGLTGCV